MVNIELLIQQATNGLFFGGQIALTAVGLTLIWGVMDVLNFAHGSMLMIGGFIGLLTYDYTGLFSISILTSLFGLFIIGVATNKAIVKPLRDRENSDVALIVGTFGLAISLQHAVNISLGSRQRSFPSIFEGFWEVGWMTIEKQSAFLFMIAIAILAILILFIQHSKTGFAIRAVSQNADVAKLMGVNINKTYSITFGLGAALAGLSGVLIAPIYNVYPAVGWQPFLLAFIVVIIGGLGSIRGTLIAALAIGVFRSVTLTWFSSQITLLLMFAAMIAILLILPNGVGALVEQ